MGSRQKRKWLLHAWRVGIFLFLLFLIRQQHAWYLAQRAGQLKIPLTAADVSAFYPEAGSLSEWDSTHGGQNVLNQQGKKIGHVIQTMPEASKIFGFSGPTNAMIAFDDEGQILGLKVLQSDDTREHVAEVRESPPFLTQWNDKSKSEAIAMRDFDIVSGATLTSTAIAEGITTRLGGRKKSRFPEDIEVSEVVPFLPEADSFGTVEKRPFLKSALDPDGNIIGYASRTSPHADDMIGYQGPTDILIVTNPEEMVLGLAVRKSLDNEPYITYLKEDEYFLNAFTGFELSQVAQLDIAESGFDIVSGASKTSTNVAEGLVRAAREISRVQEPVPPPPLIKWRLRDIGTILVACLGIFIAFSKYKGNRKLRLAFQIVLIVYLGFINADMLSQALVGGWAKNGIAWQVAPGLVFLSLAALILPVVTGKNVYCSHLCPFGAAQDIVGKKLPWKPGIKGKAEKILSLLPVVLLLWCLVITIGHLPVSLPGLEAFDAFVIRLAGWSTLAIAIVGLLAATVSNRAYCRYGCPTGVLLKFLRFSSGPSDQFGKRDFAAAGFALVGLAVMFLTRQG